MRFSTVALTAALISTATASHAANPIELVMEFQPTRREATLPAGYSPSPYFPTSPVLTGTLAEPYVMRFLVEERTSGPIKLSDGSRVLSFDNLPGSNPWTPYMQSSLPSAPRTATGSSLRRRSFSL